MKRKETYFSRDFRETAAQRFPAQAKELNTAFDMRLSALLAENADASKEKQYHLKRQICRAFRPTRPCSGSCRKRRHCKPFTAMWSTWRERATNSLPPCCTYRGFTACSRRFCQIHPECFRPGGGLCPKRTADRQRRLACGYDEVSLSRHLHRIRLSRAVPLLLRQR